MLLAGALAGGAPAWDTLPGALAGHLNYDGLVNFADLNLVLASFGKVC